MSSTRSRRRGGCPGCGRCRRRPGRDARTRSSGRRSPSFVMRAASSRRPTGRPRRRRTEPRHRDGVALPGEQGLRRLDRPAVALRDDAHHLAAGGDVRRWTASAVLTALVDRGEHGLPGTAGGGGARRERERRAVAGRMARPGVGRGRPPAARCDPQAVAAVHPGLAARRSTRLPPARLQLLQPVPDSKPSRKMRGNATVTRAGDDRRPVARGVADTCLDDVHAGRPALHRGRSLRPARPSRPACRPWRAGRCPCRGRGRYRRRTRRR